MHRYKISCQNTLAEHKAYDKILEGVKYVVGLVGMTLGPWGRNVLSDQKGAARITNDGVSVASMILMEDELANQAAQAVVEAAKKTSEMAGDGTTTCTVLVGSIVEKAFDKIGAGGLGENPMELKRKIQESCEEAIKELKKMAIPVKELAELEMVAAVATESEELGKKIAEVVKQVGKDGFVSVDDTYYYETSYEVVNGMKFDGTYAYSNLKTAGKTIDFKDSPIIIIDGKFQRFDQLNRILQVVQGNLSKNSAIIIAESFSKEMVEKMADIAVKFKFPIMPIKTPSLTDEHRRDIAIYTGGKFYDQLTSETKVDAFTREEDAGWADKVMVNRDEVMILGGKGKKEDIKLRIEELKGLMKGEECLPIKKKIEKRIASMASGVGLIKVGANTDVEKYYLIKKIENGVNSTKAAMEEGVVPGGGLALKMVAEKMKDCLLKECLTAPYEKIKENAGNPKGYKIGEKILDPVKVVRLALENACSLAGTLLTTGAIVAWREHDLYREIKDIVEDEALLGYKPRISDEPSDY